MQRRDFVRNMFAAGTVIYFGCDDGDGIALGDRDAFVDGAGGTGGVGGVPDQPDEGVRTDMGPDDPDMMPDMMPDEDPDLGVDPAPDAAAPDAAVPECEDLFEGGEYVETLDFTGGDPVRFHTPFNQGWDGRLYTDLRLVDRDRLATPNDEFYIRTRFPDRLDLDDAMPWEIQVSGLVRDDSPILLEDLMPLAEDMGSHVLECSGNGRGAHFGLLSAAQWSGIPIEAVLDQLDLLPEATRIEIGGFDDHSVPSRNNHSTPGAAWIFTPEQLIERGAFLATEMNGVPLPLDHGFPVRLYVPGWYGCTCIKWMNSIRAVGEDEPATSQMMEFASRTHQPGRPQLARDYRPADMHQAAMPVRVERWRVDGRMAFRIVGILWGGYEPTSDLLIRIGRDEAVPVDICPEMVQNENWTLWEHRWEPRNPGEYQLRCIIDDPNIPTRRLDTGFYDRFVTV